ncbi:unnamed protein product [Medioppia subpectinata]|uniref:Cytochrome P450 n=1 Tax=Medioppia subpectinata TaxID=1979941 RepID=A0A7R9KMZ4_9ACAR|nr:unnamed protein product [Medioppia subpectinata]CAG2105380.1 unnamed protein product [Medioppia subpectinata]
MDELNHTTDTSGADSEGTSGTYQHYEERAIDVNTEAVGAVGPVVTNEEVSDIKADNTDHAIEGTDKFECYCCKAPADTVVLPPIVSVVPQQTPDPSQPRGIKGPRPLVGVGNLWELLFEPMADLEERRFQKYGKIYGVFEGSRPILKVGEPELIKQILVKDFNIFQTRREISNAKHPIVDVIVGLRSDEWKRMRTTAAPTTSGQLRRAYTLVDESADRLMTALAAQTDTGAVELDLKHWFGCYAIDVVANCLFGTDTNAYQNPRDPFLTNARLIFTPPWWKTLVTLLAPPWALKVVGIDSETNREAVEFFHRIGQELVKRGKRDDILNPTELMSQLFATLNGGFDGNSTALTFAAHELALNQDVQSRLRDELVTLSAREQLADTGKVGGEGEADEGREHDYDRLVKLPYLDAVLSETLRLHAHGLRPSRVPSEDYRLPGTDITVEKGLAVEFPMYAMHRCPDLYPRADRFWPDRFLPENRAQLPEYGFMPFGHGPRACVGQRFAEMAIKIALVRIVTRFRLVTGGRTRVPLPVNKYVRFNSPVEAWVTLESIE